MLQPRIPPCGATQCNLATEITQMFFSKNRTVLPVMRSYKRLVEVKIYKPPVSEEATDARNIWSLLAQSKVMVLRISCNMRKVANNRKTAFNLIRGDRCLLSAEDPRSKPMNLAPNISLRLHQESLSTTEYHNRLSTCGYIIELNATEFGHAFVHYLHVQEQDSS